MVAADMSIRSLRAWHTPFRPTLLRKLNIRTTSPRTAALKGDERELGISSGQERPALTSVAGQGGRLTIMVGGLGMPAQLTEQVSSDRGQVRVVHGGRRGRRRFQDVKSGRRVPSHPGRDRPVEIDNGAGPYLTEDLVQARDAAPVGVLWPHRSGMTCRDGGLKRVRAARGAELGCFRIGLAGAQPFRLDQGLQAQAVVTAVPART